MWSAACCGARQAADRDASRWRWNWRRTCRCCSSIPVLFEQVLFNLLDNAAKYAPPGTAITLQAHRDGGTVRADACWTKAPACPTRIASACSTNSIGCGPATGKRAGTGLGLAIARGFMEAMGGTITAANRSGSQRRGLHPDPAGAP